MGGEGVWGRMCSWRGYCVHYFYYSFRRMSSLFLWMSPISCYLTCFSYLCSYLGTNGSIALVWSFCWHGAELWKSQSTSSLCFWPRAQYLTHVCSGHDPEPLPLSAGDVCCVFPCLINPSVFSLSGISLWFMFTSCSLQLINWIYKKHLFFNIKRLKIGNRGCRKYEMLNQSSPISIL